MRKLGNTGPATFDIGLGCMGMSGSYGPADEKESIATIHAALDAGITLLDTGDFYGMGDNELLIQRAVAEHRRGDLIVSVKFGSLRDPGGMFVGFDGRPAAVKTFLSYSLRRLKTDYIDIYRPSRVDPAVPIEETVGAIAEMVAKGYVRHIGLSEAGAQTIRRAHKVHPICDVQLEYSLFSRGIEREVLPTCRELGIGVTAYGVLSRGLIGGRLPDNRNFPAGDFRRMAPRFAAGNFEKNVQLVSGVREIAAAKGVNVAQLAIAWVLSRGKNIIPLIGTKRPEYLREAVEAVKIFLSADELTAIEKAVPADAVAGDRYGAAQMAILDSERSSS
ncbi:MAG TPA: aldo/keto reductase [Bacteroidota bacterium]|nr:aldo/keto reductase [Bacteroidota bacterium]